MEHGMGADICVTGGRLDFGNPGPRRRKTSACKFPRFDGVIVREFIGHDARQHEFEGWSTGHGCGAVIPSDQRERKDLTGCDQGRSGETKEILRFCPFRMTVRYYVASDKRWPVQPLLIRRPSARSRDTNLVRDLQHPGTHQFPRGRLCAFDQVHIFPDAESTGLNLRIGIRN